MISKKDVIAIALFGASVISMVKAGCNAIDKYVDPDIPKYAITIEGNEYTSYSKGYKSDVTASEVKDTIDFLNENKDLIIADENGYDIKICLTQNLTGNYNIVKDISYENIKEEVVKDLVQNGLYNSKIYSGYEFEINYDAKANLEIKYEIKIVNEESNQVFENVSIKDVYQAIEFFNDNIETVLEDKKESTNTKLYSVKIKLTSGTNDLNEITFDNVKANVINDLLNNQDLDFVNKKGKNK